MTDSEGKNSDSTSEPNKCPIGHPLALYLLTGCFVTIVILIAVLIIRECQRFRQRKVNVSNNETGSFRVRNEETSARNSYTVDPDVRDQVDAEAKENENSKKLVEDNDPKPFSSVSRIALPPIQALIPLTTLTPVKSLAPSKTVSGSSSKPKPKPKHPEFPKLKKASDDDYEAANESVPRIPEAEEDDEPEVVEGDAFYVNSGKIFGQNRPGKQEGEGEEESEYCNTVQLNIMSKR